MVPLQEATICSDKCHAINLSRRQGECDFDFCISSSLIEWTEEIKFLSFYVKRRAAYRKHAQYLRRKAFNGINILKALSQTRYGARSYHFLTLMISSIQSMVEYGAAVFNTAYESIFKKSEILQTTVVRATLGKQFTQAWWHSSLDYRTSALAFGFWINHSLLSRWSPFWEFHDGNLHPTSGSVPCIADVLVEIDGHPEHLITFQLPLLCNREVVRYHIAYLPFQRKYPIDIFIAQIYNDFIQRFTDSWNIIATDALKSSSMVAISGCTVTTKVWLQNPLSGLSLMQRL